MTKKVIAKKIEAIITGCDKEITKLWDYFSQGTGSPCYEFDRIRALNVQLETDLLVKRAKLHVDGLLALAKLED